MQKLIFYLILAIAILTALLILRNMLREQITFRPVSEQDVELVYNWLQEPHVSKWWPTPAKDVFLKDWFKSLRPKGAFPYIVFVNQKPIGLIQYYTVGVEDSSWLPKLPEHTLGIDQFIGDKEYLGKGYGCRMILAFISYLKAIEANAGTIIVDPDPANTVAIKCYEKAGFERVGEFAAPWGPALLMALRN